MAADSSVGYPLMIDEKDNKNLGQVIEEHLFDDEKIISIPQIELVLGIEMVEQITYYHIFWRIPFLTIQCNPKVFDTREEAENEIKKNKWYKRIFMYIGELKSLEE